jgi:hypothetical protein
MGHKYFLAGWGLLSEGIFPETSLCCLLSWLKFLTSVFAGKFCVITRSFNIDVFSITEKKYFVTEHVNIRSLLAVGFTPLVG